MVSCIFCFLLFQNKWFLFSFLFLNAYFFWSTFFIKKNKSFNIRRQATYTPFFIFEETDLKWSQRPKTKKSWNKKSRALKILIQGHYKVTGFNPPSLSQTSNESFPTLSSYFFFHIIVWFRPAYAKKSKWVEIFNAISLEGKITSTFSVRDLL